MKITISHNGVKRQIEGTGFNICGSGEELRSVAYQILKHCDAQDFSYGWVEVRDQMPDIHQSPNTAPRKWEE